MHYMNPVNRYCNRYFTEKEKIKILKLYYYKNLDEVQIAEKMESLPNHITWCLLRWNPVYYFVKEHRVVVEESTTE